MATEQGIFWPALAAAALSAPTGVASSVAAAFGIPVADYAWATATAVVGIIGRHGWEAKVRGSFDIKGLIFDILTAPMLGVMTYVGCGYFSIEPAATTFFILFGALLGPGWFINFGSKIADVLADRLRSKP